MVADDQGRQRQGGLNWFFPCLRFSHVLQLGIMHAVQVRKPKRLKQATVHFLRTD
jgi:hypothetical protein